MPLIPYHRSLPPEPATAFNLVPLPGRLLRYRLHGYPTSVDYEYTYDDVGRIREMKQPPRYTYRWSFDEQGRYAADEMFDEHGLDNPTIPYHRRKEFLYDGDSPLAHTVRYFEDDVPIGDEVYEIEDGHVVSLNRGQPWQQTFGYDAMGNLVRIFYWTLSVGGLPTFGYFAWYDDPVNPTLPTKERRADGFGVNWGVEWQYDAFGRPVQQTEGGALEEWTYDGPGTEAWYWGGAGLTLWETSTPWFGLANRWSFEYDAQDRPVLWKEEEFSVGVEEPSFTNTYSAVYVENVDCDAEAPPTPP